jgi:16S rRNA (cytosine1402-N4)-methyltransferase
MTAQHKPVLLDETLDWLVPHAGGTYVDCTLGGAGHSRFIKQAAGVDGCLVGIDRDDYALQRAEQVLAEVPGRHRLLKGNFGELEELLAEIDVTSVDGVLMDLGVSSFQLDTAERGFSFQQDGPLDMRMDSAQALTAEQLVNELPEKELTRLIGLLGEEQSCRRIARAIGREREVARIETTARLAAIVERAKGGRKGKRAHPATKTFQAIRMRVNGELDAVESGVEAAIRLLKPGGRLVVISFHSLEDRLVKQIMARHAGRWVSLQQGGDRWEGEMPPLRKLTRKPVTAGEQESVENRRARSAKLRAVERVLEPVRR